jgi:hypothetical protein
MNKVNARSGNVGFGRGSKEGAVRKYIEIVWKVDYYQCWMRSLYLATIYGIIKMKGYE